MRNASRLCILLAVVCVVTKVSTTAQTPPEQGRKPELVRVEMKNVRYHFTDRILVHILQLQGELIPQGKATVPIFDDKHSFVLALSSATISISTSALANVLNDHVFSARDAPLKNVSITANGDLLKVKGKLHSKGDIPFETEGTVAATSDGKIRLHAGKVKALHLPVKGLMDLLGVKVAGLISTRKTPGIEADGNDLVLDPETMLPPPQIKGRVTSVRLQGNSIVQVFGGTAQTTSGQPGNYMAYRGAELRFGKLTMSDTDLVIIDMDPKDPFDFYLDHYKEQLVAGYTKITPSFGLRVFMPDFNKLHESKKPH